MSAPEYSVIQYPHRNPDASTPLLLTMLVVPNTSPEQVAKNVITNSALPLEWLKFHVEHAKTAILVGGGPSAADHIEEIRQAQKEGAVIFAVNAASQFLRHNDITADWQVIADPKEETASLVDIQARGHLFSSAVDPSTMIKPLGPIVWHRNMDRVANCFPEHRKSEEYALIGGTSGGTHAMCIAYVLGFRNMQLYGYDSSHRHGASHAYEQSMNDSIETCNVSWAGTTYQASIAMKAQAENFMLTGRALEQLNVCLTVHGEGLLPAMWNTPPTDLEERDKYRLMWGFDTYRQVSPGEDLAPFMLKLLQPDGLTLDFGCGTGRASVYMASKGVNMMLIDFADNCRDHEALCLPFLEWDLAEPLPLKAGYGFCCDVMEHIPGTLVYRVLSNIFAAANKVFFSIGTTPDSCGVLIGQELHVTVKPHDWWLDLLAQFGKVTFQQKDETQSLFVVEKGESNGHTD